MSQEPFTPAQLERLRNLRKDGVPLAECAKILCRSRLDTRKAAKEHGIVNPGGNQPWHPDQDAILLAHLGQPYANFYHLLDPPRAEPSIRHRIYKLRLAQDREEGRTRIKYFKPVKPVTISAEEPRERPLNVPFQTASGGWAIRLKSGVVPYLPTLYGDAA
jgi:hypothetical protein